jgi:hypothetical protein
LSWLTPDATFGEPDSTRLPPYPLAGLAHLNEECRTCFALAKLETQTCFALAKLETQTCFALAKLETQTCESRLGVTFQPIEFI